MSRWLFLAVVAALALVSSSGPSKTARAQQAPTVGSTQTFVSCPIYRDTDQGRKSGCWLGDDPTSGVRYDVTYAPNKPQRGHQVLVEGVVTDERDTCGGVVLKPVRVSVLEQTCRSEQLTAEPYPGRPSPPPGETLRPASEPRPAIPPPYETRTYQIYFELQRDFLIYQHAEVALEKAALYAKASQARQVEVRGFAATERSYVSGRAIREDLSVARARAEMAALALRRLGITDSQLTIVAEGAPVPTDLEGGKLPESSKRRVTLTVTP